MFPTEVPLRCAAFVFISILSAQQKSPVPPQTSNRPETKQYSQIPQDNKTAPHDTPASGAQRISKPTQFERSQSAKNRENETPSHADSWTTIFTGLLVAVGALQFWILRRQTGIIDGSLRVARDSLIELQRYVRLTDSLAKSAARELVLTQRPKLIVRNLVINPSPERSGRTPANAIDPYGHGSFLDGHLRIVNTGGTAARIKRTVVTVEILEDLPMIPPYEGGGFPDNVAVANPEISLAPGESTPLEFSRKEALTIMETSAISRGEGIFVMGLIDYADELGIPRSTGFCRQLNRRTNRLEAVKDDDYEYAD